MAATKLRKQKIRSVRIETNLGNTNASQNRSTVKAITCKKPKIKEINALKLEGVSDGKNGDWKPHVKTIRQPHTKTNKNQNCVEIVQRELKRKTGIATNLENRKILQSLQIVAKIVGRSQIILANAQKYRNHA